MNGPDVYLVIHRSAIAYDDRGEVIETVEWNDDGTPDWSHAGICDHRGGGGADGFTHLHSALVFAERNAELLAGEKPRRLPAA